MKLYQEAVRPDEAIGFIIQHLCDGEYPDLEQIKTMKLDLEKITAERDRVALELKVVKMDVKKTASEVEMALMTKYQAFADDETGHSLLKDYLTDELFEQYKGLKTELRGTLLDNIQCGLTLYDAEIGVYASDQYAYTTFNLLFDPILKDLHEEGASEEAEPDGEVKTETEAAAVVNHPDLDWGDSDDLKDADPEGMFIESMSITIGRALSELHFMPTISIDKIKETSEKIRNVLITISDEEFAGKYHDVPDMEAEQKAKWIEEGILFAEPTDKYLEAAQTYRFFPMGRGLFLNDKGNLRVWVNEEEHLQVTSFSIGGNLKEIYQRLVKFMEFFNDFQFARNTRWGFVAHNLKNIGNTMRVSFKIKLPQLGLPENLDKLESLADGCDMAFVDLGSGVVELTTKKRFGVTEIGTVKNVQTGIGEIIAAEKCLYA